MMKKITRCLKKSILLEVVIIISAIVNLMIKTLKFEKLMRLLTNSDKVSNNMLSEKEIILIRTLKSAIDRTKELVPWRVLCYEQAIIAILFCRIWNIDITIYFGLNKNKNNKLNAHAWTQSSNIIITGGESYLDFNPIYNRSYNNNKNK